MFRTLLIANRGEIACRIARSARRLGIETIAVYSEADAHAMHVQAADRAYPIGPAAARDSYLNIGRIIDTARAAGAEAIHPGYGFLSENPAFAEACAAAGMVFVGPPASAMRAMGSKSAAKALMQKSAVPLLPGYHGDRQDAEFLADQAARIGFPVVIKAVSGGGGRGMRVVTSAADFAAALNSARQEAASAFGDDRVLVERYLQRPRHIEVQVFADTHGNAVHLFERDCSAQRRHQKVLEEAPAPGLSAAQREQMGSAAVAAAKAVGYVGAGTVEFVADAEGFFFLEMNTRLQVEHPVTEMVTGFDLVEWQLRVAAGEPLPAAQSAITLSGHAIEARIYAEDPARDFAPSVGRLALFRTPAETADIRVDTGFVTGDTVSIHYDAMLAKLICHGPTRDAARRRLRQALADCAVAGVASNLDLLGRIADHPEFAAGGIDTGFIAREAATLLAGQGTPPAEILAIAALAVLTAETPTGGDPTGHHPTGGDPTGHHPTGGDPAGHHPTGGDPTGYHPTGGNPTGHHPTGGDPWDARDQWWLNTTPARVLDFTDGETNYPVSVTREGAAWRIGWILGTAQRVAAGRLRVSLDGAWRTVSAVVDRHVVTLRDNGQTWRLTLPDPLAAADDEEDAGDRLVAPIPGLVTQVMAVVGERVARGQVLVVLEAMKTVFRLAAPSDTVVASVSCAAGEMVQEGQVLVGFGEAAPVGG
jgi:3-methylcrotonyl-CoA carboxylase alpha subunit